MTASANRAADRPGRLADMALLGQCAVAVVLFGTAYPSYWAARWVQDDAYVSFRYAANLVRGEGLVYNPGQRVEGYSNFLWTMLSAVPLALGADDPLPFMHAAGAVLWWATGALLLVLAYRLGRTGVWAAPLAVIAAGQHWSYNMWFFSGMETPLVTFLVTAMVFAYSVDPERHPRALFFASLAGVLLAMSRADGIVAFAALACAGAVVDGRRIFVERKWRTYLLAPALPVLLLWLPYTLWRVAYYGSFFPNTYYAKLAYLPFYERGWEYLRMYLSVFGLSAFLPLAAAGALLAPAGLLRRFLVAAAAVSAAVAFYVARIGGDFMEWRFLTPVTGILYLAIVCGAAVVLRAVADRLRGAAALAALTGQAAAGALLIWTTATANPDYGTSIVPGQEAIGSLRRYGDPDGYDWHSVGRLFDDVLPRDITIATTSAGIIPFFCNRPCIDLHGLTDPVIAHTPLPDGQRGRMGHEHWLDDYQEIRDRGVDILLLWAEPRYYAKALVTPPRDGFETVSVRLPDGRFVDFLILNPAAIDRAALVADPRVVTFGQTPIADRRQFYALAADYADYTPIGALDLEEWESQERHGYEEFYPPDRPGMHIFHTKFLSYGPPLEHISLEDSGRRIYLAARWQVFGVDPRRDLVLIGRHDHTNGAVYDVEVNGHATGAQLHVRGEHREFWGEAAARIAAEYLVAGTNDIRIQRSSPGESDAQWYHFWFLQPPANVANASLDHKEPR